MNPPDIVGGGLSPGPPGGLEEAPSLPEIVLTVGVPRRVPGVVGRPLGPGLPLVGPELVGPELVGPKLVGPELVGPEEVGPCPGPPLVGGPVHILHVWVA